MEDVEKNSVQQLSLAATRTLPASVTPPDPDAPLTQQERDDTVRYLFSLELPR